jgi:hypothetical protein
MYRDEVHRRTDADLGQRLDDRISVPPECFVNPDDIEMPGMAIIRRPRRKFKARDGGEMRIVLLGNFGPTLLPTTERGRWRPAHQ